MFIHTHDDDPAFGDRPFVYCSQKQQGERRITDSLHLHLDLDEIVENNLGLKVTLHMDARKAHVDTSGLCVSASESPEKLLFSRFKVAEHSGVVDPLARVDIDEADS